MRPIIFGLLLLAGLDLALTVVVQAQAQLPDYYDVTLRKNQTGMVVVVLGDNGGRSLPASVITSLVFVAAWARTAHPTAPVTVKDAGVILPIPLILPAVGFAVMHETPLSAVVRIGHLTVQVSADLYVSSALLTLERVAADAPWTVTAVTVQ